MSSRLENVLAARGVGYRDSGRFELLVRCPMCGAADPSEHLAISTRGRGWRCLRNPRQHKGSSYPYLLSLLLNISKEDAAEMLGEHAAAPLPDQDKFSEQWRKQLGIGQEQAARPRVINFPKQFRALEPGAPRSQGFWEYLTGREPHQRGLTRAQAQWVAHAYKLQFALSGRFSYRVILPVHSRLGKLMTWTGRAIDSDAEIRYLTLSSNPEKADYPALAPTTDLLLGLPLIWRANPARCLVVCEGPFDAIAISVLGHEHGIWGTCIFGLELTLTQADLLAELGDWFPKMALMIDPTAMLRILEMRDRLPRRCRSAKLLEGLKDPGELVKHPRGKEFVLSLAA